MEPQCTQDVDIVLYVTQKTDNVSVNIKGVEEIVMEVLTYMIHNYENDNISEVAFGRYVRLLSEFHPKSSDHRAADWLFVLNTLNFALWPRKNEQEWRVDGLTGYMAVCAAVKRAIDNGKPIWDPQFYANLSMTDMKDIFRGDDDNVIPCICQRLFLLRAVGEILLETYKGTFAECIKLCQWDVVKMLDMLLKFPSYDGSATYGYKSVPLHIKAWILINDIWYFFNIKTEMAFSTIFADFRIVQVFNHFNALVYSKQFLDKLEKIDELVTYGSTEEIEIRCCSLLIVRYLYKLVTEKCKHYIEKYIPELQILRFNYTCLVDNFLWDYRQIHDEQVKKSVLCKISTEQY